VRSGVTAVVEAAVLRALERIPADRFPDLGAFAAALRSPESPGSVHSDRRRPSKGWRAVAGIGLLAAVLMGLWLRFGTASGARRSATDPEVVALYQRGLRGYDRRSSAGITDAIAAFSAAVRRDSTYAPAWNGLAKSYVRAYERAFPIPGAARDSMLLFALSAVERALAADSGSGDVWLTQALLSRDIDPTDNGPVLRSLRQSIALDSTDAPAWHFLALALAETGDFTGALAAWHRCLILDPRYTQGLAFLALGFYWRRQYDSARTWADSAVALDPNYLLGRNTVGYVAVERGDYDHGVAAFDAARRLTNDVEALNSLAGAALAVARAGRRAEARAMLRNAEARSKAYAPAPLHTAIFMAQVYAALGDADRAVAWLTRYQPRGSLHFQLHLRCDPPFDPIVSDRRFRSLLTLPAPLPGGGC
jgi:tetratricopeptide (TPR) repeat protein